MPSSCYVQVCSSYANRKEGLRALENAEISSELLLEEVKCDYTVSESDFTAKICFYTSF